MKDKFNWENRRIFVTGATGLLGSHLVEKLIEKKASVVALIRDQVPRSRFYSESLHHKVISIYGDVTDFHLLERTLCEYEIETVFHLAAQTIVGIANQSPLSTLKTNIDGTYLLLEACRHHSNKIKEIIVASSDKAYGHLVEGKAYDESSPLCGRYPYDVSKSCADLIAQMYFHSYQLPVVTTRCGNFFGPGDLNFNRLIPGVIRDCLYQRSPLIRSNGLYSRDFIYIEDAVFAYLLLAENIVSKNLYGESFNFSYGEKQTVLDVVGKILDILKHPVKPDILNEAVNEIPIQMLSNVKAKTILGWSPTYGFMEGLQKTISWYQKEYPI